MATTIVRITAYHSDVLNPWLIYLFQLIQWYKCFIIKFLKYIDNFNSNLCVVHINFTARILVGHFFSKSTIFNASRWVSESFSWQTVQSILYSYKKNKVKTTTLSVFELQTPRFRCEQWWRIPIMTRRKQTVLLFKLKSSAMRTLVCLSDCPWSLFCETTR